MKWFIDCQANENNHYKKYGVDWDNMYHLELSFEIYSFLWVFNNTKERKTFKIKLLSLIRTIKTNKKVILYKNYSIFKNDDLRIYFILKITSQKEVKEI
jgi:hypothetical protein